MKQLSLVLLGLAACAQQKTSETRQETRQTAGVATPAKASSPAAGSPKRALMVPIPKDHGQLERLLAMGYTIHEDHLHAPGVTSCPKMSENPVQ
jgi:hypothetical protein